MRVIDRDSKSVPNKIHSKCSTFVGRWFIRYFWWKTKISCDLTPHGVQLTSFMRIWEGIRSLSQGVFLNRIVTVWEVEIFLCLRQNDSPLDWLVALDCMWAHDAELPTNCMKLAMMELSLIYLIWESDVQTCSMLWVVCDSCILNLNHSPTTICAFVKAYGGDLAIWWSEITTRFWYMLASELKIITP